MAIFHFLEFVHELFCLYFQHLNGFLVQCCYCVGKWKILSTTDEGVNNETRIFSQFWNFHNKNVDEA